MQAEKPTKLPQTIFRSQSADQIHVSRIQNMTLNSRTQFINDSPAPSPLAEAGMPIFSIPEKLEDRSEEKEEVQEHKAEKEESGVTNEALKQFLTYMLEHIITRLDKLEQDIQVIKKDNSLMKLGMGLVKPAPLSPIKGRRYISGTPSPGSTESGKNFASFSSQSSSSVSSSSGSLSSSISSSSSGIACSFSSEASSTASSISYSPPASPSSPAPSTTNSSDSVDLVTKAPTLPISPAPIWLQKAGLPAPTPQKNGLDSTFKTSCLWLKHIGCLTIFNCLIAPNLSFDFLGQKLAYFPHGLAVGSMIAGTASMLQGFVTGGENNNINSSIKSCLSSTVLATLSLALWMSDYFEGNNIIKIGACISTFYFSLKAVGSFGEILGATLSSWCSKGLIQNQGEQGVALLST